MLGIISFMKYCHTITVNVFVKPENILEDPETEEKTKTAIRLLLPVDWEKEKIKIQEIKAEGFEGRQILIYELKINKEKETNAFLKNLASKLSKDQKEFLRLDKELRLDENDDFFIRLDRKKLFQGIYELTTSGDCFHIKMNIASFPKKRENTLKVIDEIFAKTI